MVKISVIVPVYNGVEYIRECVDSIIAQTLMEIEIIIVDAGSTDGTLEILQSYEKRDARIQLLHADKKSMGYQTNLGILAASGEYIGFCEADDYLAPAMYERLYSYAVNDELDFVKSDFDMFIEGEGERVFLNYGILAPKKREWYMKVISPLDHLGILHRDVNMWNGIYNREFIRKNNIRLNETPKAAFQDMGFILQTFLLADKIMYVQEEANRYRRDNINSSVYNQRNLIYIAQEFEFIDEILMKKNIENKKIWAIILARFLDAFCAFYRPSPVRTGLTRETETAIERYVGVLRKIYAGLEYQDLIYEGLNTSIDLQLLLEDFDFFDLYRKKLEKIRSESLNSFYAHVKKYDKAIIFGAGERGTSCLGLLKKNHDNRILCFCDNNPSLWNTQLMGLDIVSIDQICTDGILFIVANADMECWKEMYDQLIWSGIDPEQICRAPDVIPHHAFELRLWEENNEKNNTDCNNNG